MIKPRITDERHTVLFSLGANVHAKMLKIMVMTKTKTTVYLGLVGGEGVRDYDTYPLMIGLCGGAGRVIGVATAELLRG